MTGGPLLPLPSLALSAAAAPLDLAYEHCRRSTPQHGKTYYLATRLLPPARRPYVRALYAFARNADEFVDDLDAPDPEALVTWAVRRWPSWPNSEARRPSATRCCAAHLHTVRQLGLERRWSRTSSPSMQMDITVDRYAT